MLEKDRWCELLLVYSFITPDLQMFGVLVAFNRFYLWTRGDAVKKYAATCARRSFDYFLLGILLLLIGVGQYFL